MTRSETEIERGSGVAIVGASPGSFWTYSALRNIRAYGYEGPVWPVNPAHRDLDGLVCYPDISSLPGRPEVALVVVRGDRCVDVVGACVDLGVDDIVVISDGFAERGEHALQERLASAVNGSRSQLFGPNCVGFIDLTNRLCAIGEPIPLNVRPGPISFVGQSGALVSAFMSACVEEGLGMDWCVSTGNGASIDVAEGVRLAVEREGTRVICVYAESLGRDMVRLAETLGRARALEKWVIVLKIGTSEVAARLAKTHTGSLVGPDHLVTSFLKAHDAFRVDTLAELVRLASICAMLDHRPSGGVAVVGKSGGTATLASDSAARHGLKLARLEEQNHRRLVEAAPPGSFVDNPFDIVGLGDDDSLWEAIYTDPNVAFVVAPQPVVYPDDSEESRRHREAMLFYQRLARRTKTPTLSTSVATQSWTHWVEELRDERDDYWALGRDLDLTLRALAHLLPDEEPRAPTGQSAGSGELLEEDDARRLLAEIEAPVVAGSTFGRVQDATMAGLRPPVVVKIVASGLSHKTKVGGVHLGCISDQEVASAARAVVDSVASATGEESIQGVRIEEMCWGPELLVGLQRDELLGAHLTLGIGGVLAESIRAVRTRLLPVTRQTLEEDLTALGLDRVIDGATVEALIAMLLSLSGAFSSGPLQEIRTVEINPVILTAEGPRIADVLMVR